MTAKQPAILQMPVATFPCTAPGCTYVARHNKGTLEQHVRSKHTGERPFPCTHPGCGMGLASKNALNAHLRAHERKLLAGRELPVLLCSEPGCGFAAAARNVLVRHARASGHAVGGLPCHFPTCGLTFNSSTARWMHQQAAHTGAGGALHCKKCGEEFEVGAEYMSHIHRHKGDHFKRSAEARAADAEAQAGAQAGAQAEVDAQLGAEV